MELTLCIARDIVFKTDIIKAFAPKQLVPTQNRLHYM